jgi:hypothetical protein
MSSALSTQEKAELLHLASCVHPNLDKALLGHLAELSALGCQAKDVKDFLRCVVARSAAATAPAPALAAPAGQQG